MSGTRRFTGRQITTMVAMLSIAIVLAPVGAVAATNAFTISDPVHSARKAHVTSKGGLAVTAQDGKTGARARVDRSGHTVVGDGSGALTVDGKVNVSGTVRSYAPTATWHFVPNYNTSYYDMTRPRTDAVNLTSLFLGGDSTTSYSYLAIYAATTPASATIDCKNAATDVEMIWQGEVGGAGGATTPISVAFPTPLTSRPPRGKKICLYAYVNHDGGMLLDASGYYGG